MPVLLENPVFFAKHERINIALLGFAVSCAHDKTSLIPYRCFCTPLCLYFCASFLRSMSRFREGGGGGWGYDRLADSVWGVELRGRTRGRNQQGS